MEETRELAAMKDGFSIVEIEGVRFDRIFATECADRDGYSIEYHEVGVPAEDSRMLQVFRDHESGRVTFKTWGDGVPTQAIEEIVAHAIEEFSNIISNKP